MIYEQAPTPTFTIYTAPDSKETVPSLKHCFIERVKIDTTNPPALIRARNGHVYQAVYDTKLPAGKDVETIISFQAHTYGLFAVIRIPKDKEQRKGH